jgi:hypothetical protein
MHEIFAGHDFAIKNASRHNPLQSDTRNDVRRMISKAAMKQAESLCRQQQQIFASIGDKCMGYVRINQSILGAFETQTDADRLFLMLVRTELDHPAAQLCFCKFREGDFSVVVITLSG